MSKVKNDYGRVLCPKKQSANKINEDGYICAHLIC